MGNITTCRYCGKLGEPRQYITDIPVGWYSNGFCCEGHFILFNKIKPFEQSDLEPEVEKVIYPSYSEEKWEIIRNRAYDWGFIMLYKENPEKLLSKGFIGAMDDLYDLSERDTLSFEDFDYFLGLILERYPNNTRAEYEELAYDKWMISKGYELYPNKSSSDVISRLKNYFRGLRKDLGL